MQQAATDLNFPQSDVRVGNTAPADREVADAWTAASNHVSQDTSAVVGKASPEPTESVSPDGAAWQLGKTSLMAVQGGRWMDVAARAVGKHPLQNSPCRDWVALFTLCKVGTVLSYECGVRCDFGSTDVAVATHDVPNIEFNCALITLTLGDSHTYDETRVGLLFPLGPKKYPRSLMDKAAFLLRA